MKKVICFWKCMGMIALVLGLFGGPWITSQARAQASTQAASVAAQATPQPTVQSTPLVVDEQPQGSWLLLLLLIVCSMVGLLVAGVGAAILLARLRQRF